MSGNCAFWEKVEREKIDTPGGSRSCMAAHSRPPSLLAPTPCPPPPPPAPLLSPVSCAVPIPAQSGRSGRVPCQTLPLLLTLPPHFRATSLLMRRPRQKLAVKRMRTSPISEDFLCDFSLPELKLREASRFARGRQRQRRQNGRRSRRWRKGCQCSRIHSIRRLKRGPNG